jgi:hypothetical protein
MLCILVRTTISFLCCYRRVYCTAILMHRWHSMTCTTWVSAASIEWQYEKQAQVEELFISMKPLSRSWPQLAMNCKSLAPARTGLIAHSLVAVCESFLVTWWYKVLDGFKSREYTVLMLSHYSSKIHWENKLLISILVFWVNIPCSLVGG